jgi:hypothetical protein
MAQQGYTEKDLLSLVEGVAIQIAKASSDKTLEKAEKGKMPEKLAKEDDKPAPAPEEAPAEEKPSEPSATDGGADDGGAPAEGIPDGGAGMDGGGAAPEAAEDLHSYYASLSREDFRDHIEAMMAVLVPLMSQGDGDGDDLGMMGGAAAEGLGGGAPAGESAEAASMAQPPMDAAGTEAPAAGEPGAEPAPEEGDGMAKSEAAALREEIASLKKNFEDVTAILKKTFVQEPARAVVAAPLAKSEDKVDLSNMTKQEMRAKLDKVIAQPLTKAERQGINIFMNSSGEVVTPELAALLTK